MRAMTFARLVGSSIAVSLLMLGAAAPSSALAGGDDLKRDVESRLSKEDSLGTSVEVAVRDREVTLTGTVATLWQKEWAIDRARGTHGVNNVVSHLLIANPEGDAELAKAVGDAIGRYPYYTVFDYVRGTIENGVVTLRGEVTPSPDKPGDIYERVSRVRGVQEIVNEIDVLSPGIGDERLRTRLAWQLFGHPSFDRYHGVNPGLHIIVRNGYVKLKGAVYDQADKILAESIARRTFGVIRVENELRTRQELLEAANHQGGGAED